MALRYDACLFDFDGTLVDTGEGIRRSVAYSLEKMGRSVPETAVLSRFIGPPLFDSYREYCGLSDDEAERAIEYYRERYADIGLYESELYPGIDRLLKRLHDAGAYVAIASAKPQFMLERLAAHFGITGCLDAIVGVGLDRRQADKRDLILRALPVDMMPAKACMIGDRKFDIEAAVALGLAGLGAGYGYALPGELAAAGAEAVYDTVDGLSLALLGPDERRGVFISLEGSDGCGKSTQIALLEAWLREKGFEVVLTREPGGCPISERIREIILSLNSRGMSPQCEALLYAASRAEHVREVIEPSLKCGKIVICDRFLDSSIAYQGYGRELGERYIRQINEGAVSGCVPDLTLLLAVERSEAKRRMSHGAPPDRMESEKEDFFLRVQEGFDSLSRREPGRIRPIDASRAREEVFMDIREAVERPLAEKNVPKGRRYPVERQEVK